MVEDRLRACSGRKRRLLGMFCSQHLFRARRKFLARPEVSYYAHTANAAWHRLLPDNGGIAWQVLFVEVDAT